MQRNVYVFNYQGKGQPKTQTCESFPLPLMMNQKKNVECKTSRFVCQVNKNKEMIIGMIT